MEQEVIGTVVQVVRGVGSQTLLSRRLQALGYLVDGVHTVLVTSSHLVWGTWAQEDGMVPVHLGAGGARHGFADLPRHRLAPLLGHLELTH